MENVNGNTENLYNSEGDSVLGGQTVLNIYIYIYIRMTVDVNI